MRISDWSSDVCSSDLLTQVLGLMISDSDIARNAIFEILDNQLAQGSPPEVRETLDRLLAAGHPEEEARRLLGCVIASEVFAVLQEGRDFDRERSAQELHALPTLPWVESQWGLTMRSSRTRDRKRPRRHSYPYCDTRRQTYAGKQ